MKLILLEQSPQLGDKGEEAAEDDAEEAEDGAENAEAEEADAEDVEADESEDVPMVVDEIEVSSIPIHLILINFRHLKGFSDGRRLKGFQETCPYKKAEELVRGVGWDYEAPRPVNEAP